LILFNLKFKNVNY